MLAPPNDEFERNAAVETLCAGRAQNDSSPIAGRYEIKPSVMRMRAGRQKFLSFSSRRPRSTDSFPVPSGERRTL